MSKGIEEFEGWLRAGGSGDRGISDSTIATYLKVVRRALRLKRVTDILRGGLGVATKQKYASALRQWAMFAEDTELMALLTPGPALKRLLKARESRLPETIEAFSDEEVQRFLDVLARTRGREPRWIWPCVSLQVHLGLRASADLAGLHRTAIAKAVSSGRLSLMGKREKISQLPAGFVEEELRELLELEGWSVVADLISPETRKEPWEVHRTASYRAYRNTLIALGELAGIDASRTHRFRHWAISRYHREVSGGDALKTMRFARHSKLDTTMRYIHLTSIDEDDVRLAELKNLRKPR